jgi:hypothetical protein
LFHETREPACKTAVNWVTKPTHRMTQRNAIERWEAKISNSEVTPHVLWHLEKSLIKRDRSKAPTAMHSPSVFSFLPLRKANVTVDCLENQFSPHDVCEENRERRIVARVQALFEAVDDSPPERVRPCDAQKLIKFLKLKNAFGIYGIPNECLRRISRRPLVHLTHLFNHCLWLSYFPSSWNEPKAITSPKPGKSPKFPKNLRPISLLFYR